MLPNEIIMNILSYCEITQSLFCVSKRFERLCEMMINPYIAIEYLIGRNSHDKIKRLLILNPKINVYSIEYFYMMSQIIDDKLASKLLLDFIIMHKINNNTFEDKF